MHIPVCLKLGGAVALQLFLFAFCRQKEQPTQEFTQHQSTAWHHSNAAGALTWSPDLMEKLIYPVSKQGQQKPPR